MPVNLPPQFNQLNVAGIDQAAQQTEWNALRNQSEQQRQGQFDENTRIDNSKWMAGAAKQMSELGPAEARRMFPQMIEEGRKKGIWQEFNEEWKTQSDDEFMASLSEMYNDNMMALAGQDKPEQYEDVMQDDALVGQRNAATNKYDPIGASAKGPSSPMQNYEYRTGLADKFGTDSKQVKTFDSYVRAQKVTDIGGVPTSIGPDGVTPLSTLGAETSAAADIALAEGEGGRGRLQAPGGDFEAVPGSEADIKQKDAERKRSGGAFMKSIQSQTVVDDVERLNQQINADEVPFGRTAAIQKDLPPVMQTDGYRNANSLIESVKGNVGIDSLLRIKATGAGLGQVPQSQLDLLSRLLGELDMNQSKEQFVYTWNRMGQVYEIIMKQADADLYDLDVERPEVTDDFQSQWDAAPSGTILTAPDGTQRRKP